VRYADANQDGERGAPGANEHTATLSSALPGTEPAAPKGQGYGTIAMDGSGAVAAGLATGLSQGSIALRPDSASNRSVSQLTSQERPATAQFPRSMSCVPSIDVVCVF
jgi:hypothetical protein